jgi:hypothetical protein
MTRAGRIDQALPDGEQTPDVSAAFPGHDFAEVC